MQLRTKSAFLGLLLAFALILSYIETLIPFSFGIPGIKLGLANLAVLLTLYLLGPKEAVLLTITKAVLTGFLFGNLSMILYSLSGAVCSVLIMILLWYVQKIHLPVVSVMGGVFHNIGQLLTAYLIIQQYGILYYTPVLLISGFLTGFLIGFVASLVLPYIRQFLPHTDFVERNHP